MPAFGLNDADLNGVIRYFGSIANTIGPFQTHEITLTREDQAVGKELFDLLRCQQCHVLGTIPADQPTANLAPDLRMAPERLNPGWIDEWMKTPLAFLPGTRMPAYWPDFPKSPFPQLGGDAAAQIRAVRDHLMTFRGGPSPKRPGGSVVVAAAN
jgi:mono/diheme cytochrome c family protein